MRPQPRLVAALGSGLLVVAVGALVVALLLSRGRTENVAEPLPSALETIETALGRWEILTPPPAPLIDHFTVAVDGGRVLIGSTQRYDTAQTIEAQTWLLDLGAGTYEESGEQTIWFGPIHALKRPDGSVVVVAEEPLLVARDPGHPLPGTPRTPEGEAARLRTRLRNELRVWDPTSGQFSPLEITLPSADLEAPVETFPLLGGQRIGPTEGGGIGLTGDGELVMVRVGFSSVTTVGGNVSGLGDDFNGVLAGLWRYDVQARDLVPIVAVGLKATQDYNAESFSATVGPAYAMLAAAGEIALVDVQTGEAQSLEGQPDQTELLVWPSAVWLADGRLLLSGGYDPAGWVALAAALKDEQHGRQPGSRGAFAVLQRHRIPASNRVLLVDPADGTIEPLEPLPTGRVAHTMTLLPDGRVLIAGGQPAGGASTRPAEAPPPLLYDPASGTYEQLADAPAIPASSTATLLLDGSVLFLGTASEEEALRTGPSRAIRFIPAAS